MRGARVLPGEDIAVIRALTVILEDERVVAMLPEEYLAIAVLTLDDDDRRPEVLPIDLLEHHLHRPLVVHVKREQVNSVEVMRYRQVAPAVERDPPVRLRQLAIVGPFGWHEHVLAARCDLQVPAGRADGAVHHRRTRSMAWYEALGHGRRFDQHARPAEVPLEE